ncbi:hypothetical protein GGTG_12816 [Gaeumannomyces tritici R3-111a-1]|uniref:Trichothecene 3-O-acetyltransferase-like N-terminal domain-containing protein n=1 Tax=Gaeumannomyces tritici (strain R3-111a-1) TaxID=644352 RepID=J3PH36_GAET3|nr:hypothetical protein GGTG_12816 [Gaeumannomyces tritici R3-111a-1]EJT69933.1 hypothetical protein GGTG_12816 [Gaeumannomyces tritici R3-111a-1]
MASPGTSTGDHAFPHLTDVLGSLPMLRRYSLISLFFRLADDSTGAQEKVVTHLQQALASLASAVPWLAGRVVFEGSDATRSGIRHIVSHRGTIPLFVKHLGQTTAADHGGFPSFAQLQDADFPMAFLDSDVLVPRIAISWDSTNPDIVAPVLVLQANFVDGGLVLTVCSNHTTMDMTGLKIVIRYIAKACRGESLSSSEVAQANQDRRHVVPLLGDDYQPGPELDDSLVKPAKDTLKAQGAAHPKPAKWAYFKFSNPALAELKREASKQDAVPYITTDDAVSALCWQRIQAARRATLGPAAAAESQLCRTVSMRKALGLEGYTGHVVDCAYARAADVCDLPLGAVAATLRRLVRDGDAQLRHFRAYATVLDRLDDKSAIVSGARLDPRSDVVVSSYVHLRSCADSFGPLLGAPVAARRPRMPPWPSLLYLMPKDAGGGIAVAACLPEDEVEFLRRDEEMARYAVYIG